MELSAHAQQQHGWRSEMKPLDQESKCSAPPSPFQVISQDVQREIGRYQTKMAQYLFDMACLEGLEHFPERQALPRQFLVYLRKVVALHDESVRFLLGELRRHGYCVRCGPGCSACCQNMPSGASVVELIYLYHGMQESGMFSRFFRRFLEAEECFADVYTRCQGDMTTELPATALLDKVLAGYHALGRGCAFLHNELCQLYSYRPFACRMHFSLSPRHWCDPRHFHAPYAVIFNVEPGKCVYEALDRLEERLRVNLSEVMACGILELTVNVMRFDRIHWLT
jgi:Fe-S-cluster containining protein